MGLFMTFDFWVPPVLAFRPIGAFPGLRDDVDNLSIYMRGKTRGKSRRGT